MEEKEWEKPVVEHVLARPNANTVSDAMSTLDGLYKIPIKVASQHHSWQYLCFLLCVGNTFSCTACWGIWRSDAASTYHVVEQRTERCKLTRHSIAPARSFRPVSTTVELLMLRNNLLCLWSVFLHSLDCHMDVVFSSEDRPGCPSLRACSRASCKHVLSLLCWM